MKAIHSLDEDELAAIASAKVGTLKGRLAQEFDCERCRHHWQGPAHNYQGRQARGHLSKEV